MWITSCEWRILVSRAFIARLDLGPRPDHLIISIRSYRAIAHYSEPRDVLSGTIKDVKSRLPSGSTSRTTVYSKGPESKVAEDMKGLMVEVGADAVIALENVGREGETYLVRKCPLLIEPNLSA